MKARWELLPGRGGVGVEESDKEGPGSLEVVCRTCGEYASAFYTTLCITLGDAGKTLGGVGSDKKSRRRAPGGLTTAHRLPAKKRHHFRRPFLSSSLTACGRGNYDIDGARRCGIVRITS